MDFKILGIAFVSIMAAELADKTQLIGLSLAAKSGKPMSVYVGSVVAYMIITVITVAVGAVLARYIKPDVIKYVGAGLFIIIGILMFLGKI